MEHRLRQNERTMPPTQTKGTPTFRGTADTFVAGAKTLPQHYFVSPEIFASRVFRAKKKIDHLLKGLLPGTYLPLYAMVRFTRIPYAEVAAAPAARIASCTVVSFPFRS